MWPSRARGGLSRCRVQATTAQGDLSIRVGTVGANNQPAFEVPPCSWPEANAHPGHPTRLNQEVSLPIDAEVVALDRQTQSKVPLPAIAQLRVTSLVDSPSPPGGSTTAAGSDRQGGRSAGASHPSRAPIRQPPRTEARGPVPRQHWPQRGTCSESLSASPSVPKFSRWIPGREPVQGIDWVSSRRTATLDDYRA